MGGIPARITGGLGIPVIGMVEGTMCRPMPGFTYARKREPKTKKQDGVWPVRQHGRLAYDDLQNLGDYEMRSELELFGSDAAGRPVVPVTTSGSRNGPRKGPQGKRQPP
jgi:hypothetical protein